MKKATKIEMVKHEIKAENWYATQVGRAVEIREAGSGKLLDTFAPPKDWGKDWAWNHVNSLIASGIVFVRTEN